jgi:polysaccharide pyruvyl transferase WcaK-like protein
MTISLLKSFRDRLSPKPATIVLLNDSSDQANYGALALVDGLKQIIAGAIPAHRLVPIPSHWLFDAADGLAAFWNGGQDLAQPQALWPDVADQFEIVAEEWLAGRGGPGAADFLARLSGADLVILNGEGSLYRTNVSAIRELFLAWFARTRLNIPTLFLNGLVHLTLVVPVLPAMVRKTFAVLDGVAVREPCSLRNLNEYVPGVAARFFPDSAYALDPDPGDTPRSVSDLVARLGGQDYFCFDPGSMPIDHQYGQRSALYQLISKLKQTGLQAVIVASSNLEGYAEQLARDTGSPYFPLQASYRDLMALLSGAKFQVTGRYHNPILGAMVGCPSISIATSSHKNHGTCEALGGLIGMPFDGTDLRTHTPAMLERAQDYIDHQATLRPSLQAAAARLRAQTAEMAPIILGALRQKLAVPA